MPQNFSFTNSATTLTSGGGNRTGVSLANLRGLGSSATLVLINGRRTSASAEFEAGEVNIANVPFSAIERVEVLLDGASAIYGADALGGVINFILKENYTGATSSVRFEESANDGHHFSLSQNVGINWGSGSLTANLGYSERKGTSAFKIGYDTNDFSSRGGTDWVNLSPLTALRRQGGAPGLVGFGPSFNPTFVGVLPAGSDGVNWVHDLTDPNNQDLEFVFAPIDEAAEFPAGSTLTKSKEFSFTFDQEITENMRVFLDGSYSESANEGERGIPRITVTVPGENIFNGFDLDGDGNSDDVVVNYLLINEYRAGLIDQDFSDNTFTSRNLTAGITMDLDSGWQLTAEVTGSDSNSDGGTVQFPSREDSFNFQTFQTELNALGYALRGSDEDGNPVPFFNPFGDQNAHESGIDLRSFATRNFPETPDTALIDYELSANGSAFSLPSGQKAQLAVGATYRPQKQDIEGTFRTRLFDFPEGVGGNLDADISAAYFELGMPLVSEENALPGVQSLLLTIAGRYDDYSYSGPFDRDENGVRNVQADRGYSHFSPQVRMLWEPVASLKIRASWGESFRAPDLEALFRGEIEFRGSAFTFFDDVTQSLVTIPVRRSGNPDVRPEVSTTITAGFDWSPEFLEGLTVTATWTDVDWIDRIDFVSTFDPFVRDNPTLFPQNLIRDENGDPAFFRIGPSNLAARAAEYLDVTADYAWDTDYGNFDFGLSGTVYLVDEEQIIPESPLVDPIETQAGPDKIRFIASLDWTNENYGAQLIYNYSSSYENVGNREQLIFNLDRSRETVDLGRDHVEHWSSWDLTGYVDLENDIRVNVGARNVLNNKFPFLDDQNRQGYDATRVDPRGRVFYMEVKKTFDL